MNANTKKFEVIEALRFFAALTVVSLRKKLITPNEINTNKIMNN